MPVTPFLAAGVVALVALLPALVSLFSTDEAPMPSTYVCAGCGEAFDYGDHAEAEAEAARNNFDPAECLTVCDGCFNALRDLNDGAIAVSPTLN